MERSFAGFWRDGAKVQPEDRHADATGYVIGFSKSRKELYCCHAMRPLIWSEYYWLDTTTPTELTPQEAFELLKTITPTLERIEKHGDLYSAYADERISIINWGDITEYPPKQKWRVPTDADKGKKCLFWDDGDKWGDKGEGVFLGVHYQGGFLVGQEDEPILVWPKCEVLDE